MKFLLPKIQEKVKADLLDIFKKREDLSEALYVESDHTFTGFSVRLPNGEEIDVSNLRFIILGTRSYADVDQTHIKFNEMMVSTGQYIDSDGSVLKFSIVQDPETEKIHGKWKRNQSEDA